MARFYYVYICKGLKFLQFFQHSKGLKMKNSVSQLKEQMNALMTSHGFYLRNQEWKRAEYISLCLEDTYTQLKAAEAAKEASEALGDDGDNDEGDYHPYGDPQV